MSVETDFSPEAIARRRQVRAAERAAGRMLERAAHMEKRAARLRVGANGRVQLEAKASFLRDCEQRLRAEISELSCTGSARARERVQKLLDAGGRQAVRHG